MKRIVNYKTFINESSDASTLTPEQIDFLNKYVIGKWKLNDEGVVDVDGVFNCFSKGISDFKEIKFGKINGDFNCSYNNLTSLEGCPKEVGGNFYCHYSNLTSLEGRPKEVGGFFYFEYNEGVSTEILKSIFSKMLKFKLDYSDALKSLWSEIPIEDKVLLYSSDLDWVS